jgi:hypothetical protein
MALAILAISAGYGLIPDLAQSCKLDKDLMFKGISWEIDRVSNCQNFGRSKV